MKYISYILFLSFSTAYLNCVSFRLPLSFKESKTAFLYSKRNSFDTFAPILSAPETALSSIRVTPLHRRVYARKTPFYFI